MIDNIKYFIFGALVIAAAIAITGNKAKADLKLLLASNRNDKDRF